MRSYFVTLNGVTILCDEKSLTGWIDYILDLGKTPVIEKVSVA